MKLSELNEGAVQTPAMPNPPMQEHHVDNFVNQLEGIRAELRRSRSLSPYEAVDVAWVAVVKSANLLRGRSEHDRMLSLLGLLPESQLRSVLMCPAVDTLLNLDPPLESILTAQHERRDPRLIAEKMAIVLSEREFDPKAALHNLAEILKRVRNRRAHGFKTSDGPRDHEILTATADILQQIGEIAITALVADSTL